MAWMENKLMDIDPRMLLAAIQARRNRGGITNNNNPNQQNPIANMLAQEQLKAVQLANKKAEADFNADPVMTAKGMTGLGAHKEFLRNVPGYITGVSPETVFKEGAANTRAMMGAMASGGGYGYGRGGDNESTRNAPTETTSGGQTTVTSGPYGYVGPSEKPDFAQIAKQLGELYRPNIPPSGDNSSVSGSPYDPKNIKSLLTDQMNNKDSLISLANQAGLPQSETDKMTSGIDTELGNIVKPINALSNAKQAEIDNFMAGLTNKMDDKLVPPDVQQHYKKQRDAEQFKTEDNRRIQAQNYVTKAITSDPRFKELVRNQRAAVLDAIPAEMALAESQGFNKIDLDEFFSKYGRKKKGK